MAPNTPTPPPVSSAPVPTPGTSKRNQKRKGLDPDTTTSKRQKRNAQIPNTDPSKAGQTAYTAWLMNTAPKLQQNADARKKVLASNNALVPTNGTHGIMVVDMKLSQENKGKIAGYLNMWNVKNLQAVFECHKGPLEIWHDEVTDDYGIEMAATSSKKSGKSKAGERFTFKIATFMDLLSKQQILEEDLENEMLPLDRNKFPVDSPTNDIRMYAEYAKCVYQIISRHTLGLPDDLKMRQVQPIFTGKYVETMADGTEKSSEAPQLLRFDPEDIYRCIMLMRCYAHARRKKSKATDTTVSVNAGEVEFPIFALPGAIVNSIEQARLQQASMQHLYGKTTVGSTVVMTAVEAMKSWTDSSGTQEARLNDAEKVLGSTKYHVNQSMDNLDPLNMEKVVTRMTEDVEYLFRRAEKKDQQLIQEVHVAASDRARRVAEDLHAAKQQESGMPTVAIEPAKFLAFNSALSDNSATPPSFSELPDILSKFEFEDNLAENDPVTMRKFRITHHGVSLKPWQPEAVGWCTEMLSGPLGAALLCDGTGTGKTVTTLATFTELSARLEQECQRWDDERAHFGASMKTKLRSSQRAEAENLTTDEVMDMYGREDANRYWIQHADRLKISHDRPIHRPYIIIGPPAATEVWMADRLAYFNDRGSSRHHNMALLGNSVASTTSHYQVAAVNSQPQALFDWVESLDKTDPQTSRTGLVTSYGAFRRMLEPIDGEYANDNPDDLDKEPAGEDEEPAGEDEDDEDPSTTKKRSYRLKAPLQTDMFSAGASDESHRLKDPTTLQTFCAFVLTRIKWVLLTATPTKNTVHDLYGLLRFLFKAVQLDIEASGVTKIENAAAYKAHSQSFKAQYNNDLRRLAKDGQAKLFTYLSALDPSTFKGLTRGFASTQDIDLARDVLPLVYQLVVLRRVPGSQIMIGDHHIIIGDEIPPVHTVAMELRMGACQDAYYRGIVAQIKAEDHVSSAKSEDDEIAHFQKTAAHRRLRMASFGTLVDLFVQRKVDPDATLAQQLASGGLDGLTYFFHFTKGQPWQFPPSSRVEALNHVFSCSVKTKVIARLLIRHVYKDSPEKIILWANEPMTLTVLEILCQLLHIQYACIRAGRSAHSRLEAQTDFNHNPKCQAMVISSSSSTESANLQHGGHIHIITEPVSGTNLAQAIGRTNRIGQKSDQTVYILYGDETYDQYQWAHHISRYRAILSGSLTVPSALVEKLQRSRSRTQAEYDDSMVASSMGNTTTWELSYQRLSHSYINAVVREQFGFRSDRHDDEWIDWKDPKAKNKTPIETLFRFGLGGIYAREQYMLLAASNEVKEKLPIKKDDDVPVMIHQAAFNGSLTAPVVDPPDITSKMKPEIFNYIDLAARKTAETIQYSMFGQGAEDVVNNVMATLPSWADPALLREYLAQQDLIAAAARGDFPSSESDGTPLLSDDDPNGKGSPGGKSDPSPSPPPRGFVDPRGNDTPRSPTLADDEDMSGIYPPPKSTPLENDEDNSGTHPPRISSLAKDQIDDGAAGGSGLQSDGEPDELDKEPTAEFILEVIRSVQNLTELKRLATKIGIADIGQKVKKGRVVFEMEIRDALVDLDLPMAKLKDQFADMKMKTGFSFV